MTDNVALCDFLSRCVFGSVFGIIAKLKNKAVDNRFTGDIHAAPNHDRASSGFNWFPDLLCTFG